MGTKTGGKRRIGIMGGTFDPIHYGHLVTAEVARWRFGLERVIFVPAGRPPHKLERRVVPALDRLKMTELAVANNGYFTVSDREVMSSAVSYTYDTMRAFHQELGEEAELFFITGADAVLEIMQWRKIEQVADFCQFIAATRPGYRLESFHLSRKLADNIRFMEVPALAISSSDIRRRVAAGEPIKYLLPEAVEAYIREHGLYADGVGGEVQANTVGNNNEKNNGNTAGNIGICNTNGCSANECSANECQKECERMDKSNAVDERIISEQEILRQLEEMGQPYLANCMAEYRLVASGLSSARMMHSLGVAATAAHLAEKFGVDPETAYLAGLCHDAAKELPRDEMLALLRRSRLGADENVLNNRSLWHAPAGSVWLADHREEYPRFDENIQNACLWHTLGKAAMTSLEQIVFIADLIEPGRDFPDLAEIRAAAEKGLTEGMVACMHGVIRFLEIRGQFVHPLAYQGYEYYRSLL